MSGRGSTGTGRRARQPVGPYAPPEPVQQGRDGELAVVFDGEDGRSATFRIDELPLPGWHAPLAAAWAARVGPAGTLRTLASARSTWAILRRFLSFLDELPRPPAGPGELAAAQVEQFIEARRARIGPAQVGLEMRSLATIMRLAPLGELIPAAAAAAVTRRWTRGRQPGKPGYSDRELARLLTAARRDVAAVRDRLDATQRLLAANDHNALPADASARTRPAPEDGVLETVAAMAATGVVPDAEVAGLAGMRARRDLAARVFLTWPDVSPLLVLLVAVTGRNVETIKELPVEHRIIDGRAVELRVTKRRRGARRWTETVTWEIGAPRRELHTPGGLYLLLHRLCAPGRRFSGDARLWSIWRNGFYAHVTGADEHLDPFAAGLHVHSPYLRDWVAAHHLVPDTPDPPDTPDQLPADRREQGPGRVFRVDFNRLRTSVEVRRTRALGGHLPSAARSNTIPVLFRNYLRDDPTTIDWAREVVGDAVLDAEQAALDAHRRALAAAGGRLTIARGAAGAVDHGGSDAGNEGADEDARRRAKEAPWSRCLDPDRHPATGMACLASFLDCFHCGNCLITVAHLPRLLALLTALETRREQIPLLEWWARYGPVWAAIRHDVLPRFSPAELAHAAASEPVDALLDLVEAPWELP